MNLNNTLWQNKIQEMPGVSIPIILLDLSFIFLAIFLLSSNYAFLPGIKSIELPSSPNAEIIQAEKLIVNITREPHPEKGNIYTYSFNGQTKTSKGALESAIKDALDIASQNSANRNGKSLPETTMLVIRADKNIPYEEIISFYNFTRTFQIPLYFVTAVEKTKENVPIPPHPIFQ